MKAPRSPKCPLCGAKFDIKFVDRQTPFRCPACGEYLCVSHPRLYPVLSIYGALLISGLICFGLGARGEWLFWGTFLVAVPIFLLIVFWSMHFSPPKLARATSPYSGGLGLDESRRDGPQ